MTTGGTVQQWEPSASGRRVGRVALPVLLVMAGAVGGLLAMPRAETGSVPLRVESEEVPAQVVVAPDAGTQAGRWRGMAGGPLSARDDPVFTAAGADVLVWGGRAFPSGQPLRDGAMYDPTAETWQPMSRGPLSGRIDASAVWTGEDLVVWGGAGGEQLNVLRADGAAFDPAANRWRRIAPAPLSPRRGATAVWTGASVVVWGGTGPDGRPLDDGARYDPVQNRWQRVPRGPLAGHDYRATRVVGVQGGAFVWASWRDQAGAAVYDATTNRWRRLWTPSFEVSPAPAFTAVAGGVLAWGASAFGDHRGLVLKYTPDPDRWATVAAPPMAPAPGGEFVGGGAAAVIWEVMPALYLDALSNRWIPMAGRPRPQSVGWPKVAWADDRLVVWHPLAEPGSVNRGGMWLPSSPWSDAGSLPSPLAGPPTAVWTGWLRDQQQALVWGEGADGAAQGAAFDPALGLWERMPAAPIPARSDHAAAWTGEEMIVLGGRTSPNGPWRTDGARYDPRRRTWRRMTRAPMPVGAGRVVSSGQAVYAAGRRHGRVVVSSYLPDTDTWADVADPPLPRSADADVHAVWTGFELWAWTTVNGRQHGAAWDPIAHRWRRLPRPSDLRGAMSVVWGGRRMFAVNARGVTMSLGRGDEGWWQHDRLAGVRTPPQLTWTGRHTVAYDGRRLSILDPRGPTWAAVRAPSRQNARATMLWTGRHLLVVSPTDAAITGR